MTFAEVPTDSQGRSRGFGIVEYESPYEAAAAVDMLHNAYLRGRNIFVREDQ